MFSIYFMCFEIFLKNNFHLSCCIFDRSACLYNYFLKQPSTNNWKQLIYVLKTPCDQNKFFKTCSLLKNYQTCFQEWKTVPTQALHFFYQIQTNSLIWICGNVTEILCACHKYKSWSVERELNIVFEFMLMSTCSLLAYFFSSRNQWFTIHR